MKITIVFDEKEQQVIESIYEDKDKNAAFDYVINTLRAKFHAQAGTGDIKCGHIFSKSGEKK